MATAYRRALWVWTPRELNNPKDRAALLAFCAKEHITDLYYSVIIKEDPFSRTQVSVEGADHFREFIREAHQQQVRIYALFSRMQRATRPNRAVVLSDVKAIMDLTMRSLPEERCDGFHYAFDLYLAEDIQKKNLRKALLDLLQLLRWMRITLQRRRHPVKLSVEMPHWFMHKGTVSLPRMIFGLKWKEAGEHLLDIVDEIVLSPYRTQCEGEDGIAAVVTPAVEYAGKTGKKVLIGMETMALTSAKASFATLGKATLCAVEDNVVNCFQGYPGFGGIAIHDYENYRKLK